MHSDHHRYFIELQPGGGPPVARSHEDEVRRKQAIQFIAAIYDWLKNHDLQTKVSNLDVTAFGQVRITCDAEIISRLRDEDAMSIAAIRPGAMYVEGMGRNSRR